MTEQKQPKVSRRGKGKPPPDVVLTSDDMAKIIAEREAKLAPVTRMRFTYDRVDQDAADKFCSRMADGRSLRSICNDADMPSRDVVRAWLRRFPSFVSQYVRAREEQADAIFDEALSLADDAATDPELTHERLGAVRLQIDTRKWIAAKLRPSKYSDKHISEISGPDGGAIQIAGVDLDAIDREQRDALANMLRMIGATNDGEIEEL
jgi:hypothetical protein